MKLGREAEPIVASRFGWIPDGKSDNAAAIRGIERMLRASGGGRVIFDGPGVGFTSYPLLLPTASSVEVEGELRFCSGRYGRVGVFVGQLNREDLARAKGSDRSAHFLGQHWRSDVNLKVGARWDNRRKGFLSPPAFRPKVGDLVVIWTDDSLSHNPSRPLPSSTVLRRIVHVEDFRITIDKGLPCDGNYLLLPASRGLGADRAKHGGIGRVEAVRDVEIRGKISAIDGYPVFIGACIDPVIDVVVDGKSLIYANALRGGQVSVSGVFSRLAAEIKLGSEEFRTHVCGCHVDRGDSYSVGLISVGEQSLGGSLRCYEVNAPDWRGPTAVQISAPNVFVEESMNVACSAEASCMTLGSIYGGSASGFVAERVLIETFSISSDSLLKSTVDSLDMSLDIEIHGQTEPAVKRSVDLKGGGIINKLVVVGSAADVQISAKFATKDIRSGAAPIVRELD